MAQVKPWEVLRTYTDKVLVWAESQEEAEKEARDIIIGVSTERVTRLEYVVNARELSEERG